MNPSNYFEFEVRRPYGSLFSRRLDLLELPAVAATRLLLHAAGPFSVVARRPPLDARWRVRLGGEVLGTLAPGAVEFVSESREWLHDEFGESWITVEQAQGSGRRYENLFEVAIDVSPRPSVVRDYGVMIEDVARIHEGLALDVVGRSYHRHGLSGGSVDRLRPEAVLAHLQNTLARLTAALAVLAEQPSKTLERTIGVARYRGGDRVDLAAAASALRDADARIGPGGRVAALGKVRLRRPVLSEDLPEHRHIAQTIRELARRALAVGRHCERSAELLRQEEARWGASDDPLTSVYAQRDLPRVELLEELSARAPRIAAGFGKLLRSHRFLAEAGPPRTPFGPTPVFLGRPAYREIYAALLEARRPLGLLVDGDAVRIAYRDLATLYEYWCFLRLVGHLREKLGTPQSRAAFAVIDEIYRPDLKPGQEFRFAVGDRATVTVSYTPEFQPWKTARRQGQRFGAAFTRDPLRPDMVLEVQRPGSRPVLLVLDAKSTEHFTPSRFREMSDYSRQIFEPATGYQPVRQVFLLHRDRGARSLVNLPGYLERSRLDPTSVVLGAVPCVPEHVGAATATLALVVDLFLERYLGSGTAGVVAERAGNMIPRTQRQKSP